MRLLCSNPLRKGVCSTLRLEPRFPVTFTGTVSYQDYPHLITKSLDLSRAGCRLESPLQLSAGTKVNLLLCFLEGNTLILIEQAVVRWCRARQIGVEFQAISATYQTRLNRALQRLMATPS